MSEFCSIVSSFALNRILRNRILVWGYFKVRFSLFLLFFFLISILTNFVKSVKRHKKPYPTFGIFKKILFNIIKARAPKHMKILLREQKSYPLQLRQIHSQPQQLYYRGNKKNLYAKKALAVVGARRMTHYGIRICKKIVSELVKNNITIISGLAFGIDAMAHEATLENHGKTVAVLGSGLDNIYPKNNRRLAKQILEQKGTIVTEYPPEEEARPCYFPARNRIISGLAKGVLVVEAGKRSGSLITAYFGLDQGREVFAIPGNLDNPMSCGTNEILQKGAHLVTCAEDILKVMGWDAPKTPEKSLLTTELPLEEQKILKILSKKQMHINELLKKSGLPASEINAILILMETNGLIKNTGNMNYIKL